MKSNNHKLNSTRWKICSHYAPYWSKAWILGDGGRLNHWWPALHRDSRRVKSRALANKGSLPPPQHLASLIYCTRLSVSASPTVALNEYKEPHTW